MVGLSCLISSSRILGRLKAYLKSELKAEAPWKFVKMPFEIYEIVLGKSVDGKSGSGPRSSLPYAIGMVGI